MSNTLFRTIWLALMGLAFLVSCSQQTSDKPIALHGQTMGTTFNVKYYPSEHTPNQDQVLAAINKRLVDINQLMSTYIPDSELSLLNKAKAGEAFSLSPENVYLINEALRVNELSDGYYDITVGPLVNLWGFGPTGRVTKQPDAQVLEQSREWVGAKKLSVTNNKLAKPHDKTYIDLSSLAKGYGVDEVAKVLELFSVENYLVEIGGELRVNGVKANDAKWVVAIEKPPTSLQREIQLYVKPGNMGIATSGDYRLYFEENGVRYSHLIDPLTGKPIKHNLATVTVFHPSSAVADALSTAINVMGPEKGLAIAEKHNIAIYMLVRSGDGFEEIVSSKFEPYLNL